MVEGPARPPPAPGHRPGPSGRRSDPSPPRRAAPPYTAPYKSRLQRGGKLGVRRRERSGAAPAGFGPWHPSWAAAGRRGGRAASWNASPRGGGGGDPRGKVREICVVCGFFFALFVCLGACSCRPPRGHAGHCLGMEHSGTPGALPGGSRPVGGRCLRTPLLSAIFIWGCGGLSGCLSPGVPLWRSRKLRRAPRLQAGATPPLFGFFSPFF